jgi:hypothetical protein
MGLSDVVRFVRTGINLDQFFKESSNEGKGVATQTKPSESAKSSKGSDGNPPPEEPGEKRREQDRKINCTKQESPVWNNSESYKSKYRKSKDGNEIYKWDHTHNEIEVFHPKTGKHLGVRDPLSGNMIKNAVPGRVEIGIR